MLESLGSKNIWQWTACGKHPLAKDYFTIGQNNALFKIFANWLEEGYRILSGRKNLSSPRCSWRFWAGHKGRGLVCGVIKDSSDSIGRPYPFLVLGSGALEKWEQNWDLLPFACERTWHRMESIAAGMHKDVKYLEDNLRRMREPSAEWGELAQQRQRLELPVFSERDHAIQKELRNLSIDKLKLFEGNEVRLDLTQNPVGGAPWTAVVFWHFVLKSNSNSLPTAMFMGGGASHSYLNLFRRPITPDDLARLWEVE